MEWYPLSRIAFALYLGARDAGSPQRSAGHMTLGANGYAADGPEPVAAH